MAAALGCRAPCRTGWLPTLQIVRHAKSVTRHWKAMHFERQKLMAVTEYIAPKPAVPEKCIAPRIKAVKEENGYAKLLRLQVAETFRDSKMIAVCQHNFTPSEEMLLMKHRLRKHNIHVKFFPNEQVRRSEAAGSQNVEGFGLVPHLVLNTVVFKRSALHTNCETLPVSIQIQEPPASLCRLQSHVSEPRNQGEGNVANTEEHATDKPPRCLH
ncbi:39S ribosomal protein L10, mitochondrial isoform X2 [Gopherus evgoodei]|uniref:39S ribosomal protein L10, mitochondrial isoform X2 n=1 Tax=Gopherus evgoodei TaxID=1825980 RepID=UPI0011CF0D7E|nr:39S ribosomal protein L10, mitochondrial isoform X2 [Gopherus evgoodei]